MAQREAQPPGEGPVPGRRDHQGRPRRLLRGGRAGDGPAHARAADEPVALERRDREATSSSSRRSRRARPTWVARVEVPRRRGGAVEHAVANDADTLRWLAQINCITPHVWTSRVDRLDRPDRMIFDLDPPDEGADFDHIREGALAMGELLRELGREPYAMTSGSRGIHVRRAVAAHRGPRRRARAGARDRRGARRAPPRPPDHGVAQEQARGADPHRHRPQHLRADDGRAVRGPRQARRAGRDAAAVGGARGPGAARGQPHARDSAGAPGPRRRRVGRRSGGGRIGGVFWRRRARTEVAATQDLGVRVLSITRDDEPAPPTCRGGLAASCAGSSPRR